MPQSKAEDRRREPSSQGAATAQPVALSRSTVEGAGLQDLNKEDRGTMEMSLYRKIIDEARAFAFDINLAHRGESLLHPHLIEAIRYAKSQGLYTRLHTNGSLLTEDLSREIIASGLDRLSFSFDGFTKEAYEGIRRGGDFDKTIGNIIRTSPYAPARRIAFS